MAPFKELRNNHSELYIELSKESKKLKVRGKEGAISSLKDAIAQLDVAMETIKISNKEAGLVIGKGGSMIKSLTEKYSIGVEINKDATESAFVEVVGTTSNVADAVKEINQLLYQNQDVKSVVVVNKLIKNRLLENSGASLKSIQKELNKTFDTNSIRLGFESSKDQDTDNAASSALFEIASIQAVHMAAIEVLKQKIAECESNILTVHVDPTIVPKIIGKGGEKIKELKKLGKGSTIEIDKVTGEVSIFSSDENTKNLVKADIDTIVAQNQSLKIPVEEPMVGLVSYLNECMMHCTHTCFPLK